MAVITASASGGNWNATTAWDTGTVPTAADDVVLATTSGNVTINANVVARSLDCTNYTGTLTHNSSSTLTLGDATAGAGNAALTLSAAMTYTKVNSTNSAITIATTSTTQQSVTTAGKTLGNLTISGAACSILIADDLSCATLTQSGGTVAYTNRIVTCLTFTVTGTGVVAAIGGSAFNLTGTASGNQFLRTNGGNFTGSTATITIVNASTSTRDLAIGVTGTAFTVNYTLVGSTGALRFVSVANIAALNFSDTANARTLTFAASTSFTIGTWNVSGTSGLPVTVNSTTGGTAATLSKTSRTVSADYLTLQDITATGGASWYAGVNSTIVSNVTGWMLTAPSNYQFMQFMTGV